MIPSPSELEYFLEIAQALNLTRAAEKLGISQPSLSMALQRLEKTVGAPLIIRHKRGVTLSKAGKILLTQAKNLMQNWDTVKSRVEHAHREPEGIVTLGCHISVAWHFAPKVLPELLKKFPKLEVRMQHDFSYNLTDKIANFELDIGILVNPIKQPNLIIKKLYNDYDTFWHSSDKKHKLDLKNPTILCDSGRTQTQILLKKINKMNIKNPRIITSNNIEMLATLTAAGCGIGILPGCVVQATTPNKLYEVPHAPAWHEEICLVYRYENKNVGTIKTVVEAIDSFFNK